MEQIKISLKHDYNLAVDCFNNKDYISFFRNVRPAIEWMCKLFIRDLLEESKYDAIMQGRKTINKSYDKFNIVSSSTNRPPIGSALAVLMPKVYYFKHPEVYTSKLDSSLKRIRTGIDSNSKSFEYWYSVASEIGNHSGSTSMDMEIQARNCATTFPGFIDFLEANAILSDDSISYLKQLQKFSFNSVREKELSQAKKQLQEQDEQIQASGIKIKEQDLTIKERDATLLVMQKQLAEIEKSHLESLERNSDIERQLQDKIVEIEQLRAQLEQQGVKEESEEQETVVVEQDSINKATATNKLSERLTITEWDVDEESMDDDQLDLIESTMDKSMLVAGCAGSGKSVIAMHKAEQIAEAGYSVILIAYTKSLNGFMQLGSNVEAHYQFFYHYQWKNVHKMPSADYIIVDEIQDFEREEIQEFINSAKKHFLFFGDTAQSIYSHFGKKTLTIEQISEMTGLTVLHLYNNYRLPRPVAKITQGYVGVDVMPYADKVYRNKEKTLPYFVQLPDFVSQMNAIVEIIKKNPDSSIGILLHSNSLVEQTCKQLHLAGISFEYKFQIDSVSERKVYGNLDFRTILPKVMTYHSAKGLQFDIVILPMYEGANSNDSRKSLYVAMTRTMHKLYVLYSTPELRSPLNVPSHLYKKEL
jgi:hypothetical protein